MAGEQVDATDVEAAQHAAEEPATRAQHLDVIPDSLLALAKDTRYVQECQALFLQVLSSMLPRRRYQLLEQESWILSSLLCLALGLQHTSKGTSLGMETVGLQFPGKSARWKLVGFTLIYLSWAYAFSPYRDLATNQGNNINDSDDSISPSNQETQQNDEMLRGSRRREFHDRQRRAMLQRAAEAAGNPPNSSTLDSQSNASDRPENLAQTTRTDNTPVDSLLKRIRSVLLQIAKILASAVLAPFDGPHALPSDTIPNNQQANIRHAGRWLAKLQLAHFCITGMYPTWMHRFTSHALVPEDAAASKLHHRPASARLVGLLLGAQAVAAFVQASSSALSHWLVKYHDEQQKQSLSLLSEPATPAVVFESNTAAEHNHSGRRSVCSICKMERTHPAAPEACGHVFGWKCLMHWVSATRPECPLCRAPCRPQDIVALHSYDPTR